MGPNLSRMRRTLSWSLLLVLFAMGCDSGNSPEPDIPVIDAPDLGPFEPSCEPVSAEDLCGRRSAVCGPLSVVDNCGATRTIDCGSCGGGECDAGVCGCYSGYELVEEGRCVDVDECAAGTDDCSETLACTNTNGGFDCGSCLDGYEAVAEENGLVCVDIDECADPELSECGVEAVCLNTDGGYACACLPGFIQRGAECISVPPLVAKVATVVVEVSSEQEALVELPGSWNAEKTIPFVTVRANEVDFVNTLVAPDITADGELSVSLVSGTRPVTAVVSLVEFGEGAEVHQGVIQLDGTESIVDLDEPVEPDRALFYINAEADESGSGAQSDPRTQLVTASFDGRTIRVERNRTGPRQWVHYYVVETLHEHFRSTSLRVSIAASDDCGTTDAPGVDWDRSIVLHSSTPAGASPPDPAESLVTCGPSSGNAGVRCCRAAVADMDIAVETEVAVIVFEEWTGATVERGVTPVPSDARELEQILAMAPTEKSMPWLGSMAPGGIALSTSLDPSRALFTATYRGNTLLLEREADGESATVFWQSVSWP